MGAQRIDADDHARLEQRLGRSKRRPGTDAHGHELGLRTDSRARAHRLSSAARSRHWWTPEISCRSGDSFHVHFEPRGLAGGVGHQASVGRKVAVHLVSGGVQEPDELPTASRQHPEVAAVGVVSRRGQKERFPSDDQSSGAAVFDPIPPATAASAESTSLFTATTRRASLEELNDSGRIRPEHDSRTVRRPNRVRV